MPWTPPLFVKMTLPPLTGSSRHGVGSEAVEVARDERVLVVGGVVAVGHVGDPLAVDDVVQLLGADVVVRALDRVRRDRHLVEEDDVRAELALAAPSASR